MTPGGGLSGLTDALFDAIEREARRPPHFGGDERGTVTRVSRAVVEVEGFSDLMADELIAFDGGGWGLALDLRPGWAGVVMLDDPRGLRPGDGARRTRRVATVPTGAALLGRSINPLGRALDDLGPVRADRLDPVEQPAPAIIERAPITRPLQTGIKVVDALVPIGRGQRELIVGDRQTGKTAIAIDTILNQAGSDVISVYCAIGQRGDAVARVQARLREAGVMDRCVVVVAGADEPPGLQYLAPYAATSIAERFMRAGRDVLIVYDDLTRHARAWRELSLLLRRPPGREAYPGDVFYLHSRLLERATQLRPEAGGGSLTALPVVETQAQNLAAYIPTNLISITDGQIYLSPVLFRLGQLPAVDVGRSVSRVGGKAQLAGFRVLGGPLKLAYAQFEELESFARFGARLDADSRAELQRGARVRAVLRQAEASPLPVAGQIAQLLTVTAGLLDDVPEDALPALLPRLSRAVAALPEAAEIAQGAKLDETRRAALLAAVRAALAGTGDGDA
ncbi:MAG TPA: F0F1 ATP synthase subunit alpha [Paracoccus solventivorans]|uniref:ATP synthase subunit alpha n=1 Tax=Paracoccus solventivorans TaxID=53463 RepID=A0A832PRB2_9RHOB|nr:F0F1 ATP synthase subunit alpha [Paracoccus solventivorans]HHW35616.1 F0F1 ATP synthase subunit alpha [Paracoccus solventivorans]